MSGEYKERKSHHYRTYHLPEQDGHTVGVRITGPFDSEKFTETTSLNEVVSLMDPSKPVLLHWTGGPGLATPKGITRVINTRHFHLLTMSYRGTVDSLPNGKTENNTTQHIVDDGKRLLDILGVDDFYMSGFCFGSVIATTMAAQMPERCKALGLFFPYTSSQLDDGWLFDQVQDSDPKIKQMWQKIFAQAAHGGDKPRYKSVIDSFERAVSDVTNAKLCEQATKQYAAYQGSVTGCIVLPAGITVESGLENWTLEAEQKTQVAMELYYAKNDYFLGQDGIAPHLEKLKDIPMHVVYSTQNKSFHPKSIGIWQDNCPHARFVDTGLSAHHMLDQGNRGYAREMFDFLEMQSSLTDPAYIPMGPRPEAF